MPEWDEDSPRLRKNLGQILNEIVGAAKRREKPTIEAARQWQRRVMEGLDVPKRRYLGAFRGEPGLERLQVRVGASYGVNSVHVSSELARLESKLHALVAQLDSMLPTNHELDTDQLAAVIDLCAWIHAEWVRIHPFANGNGGSRACGPTALPFVTGFPLSSDCVRGPTPATQMPAPERCKATGHRLRRSSGACSTTF